jgi:beta-aspartyl-peptidase (threonine type)
MKLKLAARLLAVSGLIAMTDCAAAASPPRPTAGPFAIAVHGGAGTITRASMTPETEAEVRARLQEALDAGRDILAKGGSALDAVVAAVVVLEDSPLFNAGKGAVYTAEETHELDASIMDGSTRKAGAVAGVKRIKNPIKLARLVMDQSPHVLMAGEGAEAFGGQHGIELAPPEYCHTERRLRQLRDAQKKSKDDKSWVGGPEFAFGTVGAVAVDARGNLAAATSTGGMTNKRFGRIGDSPIVGAGTYADNRTCAVSGTGHGEYFIRGVVAHDIAALMAYGGLSVRAAAQRAVTKHLAELGGSGGVIAIDVRGEIAMPFNTEGMYRGWARSDGSSAVEIYR